MLNQNTVYLQVVSFTSLYIISMVLFCQWRMACIGAEVGSPSGHIGITMYAVNLHVHRCNDDLSPEIFADFVT